VLSFELREVLVGTQIHTPFLPQALLPLAFKKNQKPKTKQKVCGKKKSHSLTHSEIIVFFPGV
jgi:hypothetical protein